MLDSWSGSSAVLSQARSELELILVQEPDLAPAYREYARYYIMSGYQAYSNVDPEALAAAEALLNHALELDPNYADAYVLFGHLYYLRKQYQQANSALDKAEELGSTDPWLYMNRADVRIKEGDFDAAAELYRRVLDSGSTNRRAMEGAQSGLISYYRHTNRDTEAEKAYRDLIAYAPDVAWYYGNYATYLLCRMDLPDAAIWQFRIALRKMEYGMAVGGLAAAHYRRWARAIIDGNSEEASAHLKSAKELRDGDPVAIYQTHCRSSGGSALDEMNLAVERVGAERTAQ